MLAGRITHHRVLLIISERGWFTEINWYGYLPLLRQQWFAWFYGSLEDIYVLTVMFTMKSWTMIWKIIFLQMTQTVQMNHQNFCALKGRAPVSAHLDYKMSALSECHSFEKHSLKVWQLQIERLIFFEHCSKGKKIFQLEFQNWISNVWTVW